MYGRPRYIVTVTRLKNRTPIYWNKKVILLTIDVLRCNVFPWFENDSYFCNRAFPSILHKQGGLLGSPI